MDIFYQRKLRDFFNSRDRSNRVFLESVLKRTEYLQKEDIKKIDASYYEVPSQNMPDTVYLVDSRSGMCNCKAGKKGQFCKHVAAVYKFFDVKGNNIPSVTIESRREIAYVALGNDIPEYSYFLPLHMNEMSEEELKKAHGKLDRIPSSVRDGSDTLSNDNNSQDIEMSLNEDDLRAEESPLQNETKSEFQDVIGVLSQLNLKFGSSPEGIRKLSKRLNSIKSSGQWESFLHTAGNNIAIRRRHGAKIKVQPMAIQRRKCHKIRPIAIQRGRRITSKKSGKKHNISQRMYV